MAQPIENVPTAMFSPSVARIAASTAKDWSYIDSWLASKLSNSRSLPTFERNSSTLKALLALVSLNEGADENCNLMADANQTALDENSCASVQFEEIEGVLPRLWTTSAIRDELLSAIHGNLNQDGKAALDALGDMAVQQGTSLPDLHELGGQHMALIITLFEASQAALRIDAWRNLLLREYTKTTEWLTTTVKSQHYTLPPGLVKHNLDLQRKIKSLIAQRPDIQERQSAAVSSRQGFHPTVQLVAHEEEQFLDILIRKKELDSQIMDFRGLPSDEHKARDEVEALRQKLRVVASRRDEVFEGLVEKASPVKRHQGGCSR
ncbi:hypothetical protein VFPPC_14354 [Pochonia chlamydosporia 170]|uniref:HAUS augmin-like complex subunit 1 n=1 Tax=Pochonia chlamydosporia 170 TaxID=1380566 RepID=A0A179FNR3_METCM|nr:hypothetical protein VFPPC_14354 [Pochonia chlamydosporia 170]OAQ66649.1 hypothetical protein VFPPC_14354 [Pochonia chlamydosporia 170]